MSRIFLYNFIPILLHILCLPLSMWVQYSDLTLIELALDTVITPIYLDIINFKLLGKGGIAKIIGLWLFMSAIILIGHCIHYVNWGIYTGNLFMPDSETILILITAIMTSIAIVTAGLIIELILTRFINHWKNH